MTEGRGGTVRCYYYYYYVSRVYELRAPNKNAAVKRQIKRGQFIVLLVFDPFGRPTHESGTFGRLRDVGKMLPTSWRVMSFANTRSNKRLTNV